MLAQNDVCDERRVSTSRTTFFLGALRLRLRCVRCAAALLLTTATCEYVDCSTANPRSSRKISPIRAGSRPSSRGWKESEGKLPPHLTSGPDFVSSGGDGNVPGASTKGVEGDLNGRPSALETLMYFAGGMWYRTDSVRAICLMAPGSVSNTSHQGGSSGNLSPILHAARWMAVVAIWWGW